MRDIRMADVTEKPVSYREAIAYGKIRLTRDSIKRIRENNVEKGDVLTVSKISGILNAKNTPQIIPLCHPIPLTNIDIDIRILDDEHVGVKCTVKTNAQTGVEMEALVCVASSLLTIWDMVKKYEKDEQGGYPHTRIEEIRVISKHKSEHRVRNIGRIKDRTY